MSFGSLLVHLFLVYHHFVSHLLPNMEPLKQAAPGTLLDYWWYKSKFQLIKAFFWYSGRLHCWAWRSTFHEHTYWSSNCRSSSYRSWCSIWARPDAENTWEGLFLLLKSVQIMQSFSYWTSLCLVYKLSFVGAIPVDKGYHRWYGRNRSGRGFQEVLWGNSLCHASKQRSIIDYCWGTNDWEHILWPSEHCVLMLYRNRLLLQVFIHDPLYKWALSPLKALQRQKVLFMCPSLLYWAPMKFLSMCSRAVVWDRKMRWV